MNEQKHIAIVDDHIMVRKGLCALINLLPSYKVVFDADNGRDMINKLKLNDPPNIILLDLNMPEMDGYSSAHWLKIHYPQIIILAISTMDSETAIIKMIRLGAKGYILKDADPNVLQEAFDMVLKSGYYYNEIITQKLVSSLNNLSADEQTPGVSKPLSPRELEFVQLACSERTYNKIANEMFVSERTVDGYRDIVFKKFNVTSRVGMVLYAIKNKIVEL